MKKGCGCLLKLVTLGIAGIIGLLIVSQMEWTRPTSPSNCKYLSADYDKQGNFMKLYCVQNEVDLNEFRDLCSTFKTAQSGQETFRYVVLFDSIENATFPSNTYTAGFGMSDAANHILAIYEHNPLNGFSELTTYDTGNKAQRTTNKERL